ncbi:hypothetical protein J7K76_05260 [Candidatus Bipolaricaulota bacterium]|nr:hypothetical protein [Candidatus Bipolaricaulota bacterium]
MRPEQEGKVEEKLKAIVVPHTHWDREWYLTFEGFRFHLVEALDRVLNLLERSPDYRFTLDGQVLPLLDYLEIHPEMEGKLRDFIREGRLLVGPWYVQPDEFLVSGESLIRNLLYGTRIAQAFGGTMPEGYVPDSFGHIAQLPQVLTGFGIGSAFVTRGADRACEEAGGPDLLWRAPDGSAVLCHVMEMGYCNAEQLSADPAELTRSLERLVEAGLLDPEGEPFVTFLTELQRRSRTGAILLLNGCDHRGPQMDLPEVVEGLNRRFPEFRFTIGTLSDYAAALRKVKESLPVIEGEFRTPVRHPILTGVLSTRMYLKQANHRTEILLERYAEPLVALTRVLAKVDLKPFLDHSWKLLLQNHAHDSICGTGIDPIHREMEVRFARAEALATEVAREALRSLVMAQGKGNGLSVFVFNPCPWGRREEITAEIPAQAAGVVLRGPRGEKVPTAVVGERLVSEGILSGASHRRVAVISFQAELPPLGIAAFRLDPDERAEEVGARRGSLVVDDRTLENEFYRVTVYENGTFDLLDKATGRLFRGLNLLEDSGDAGDEYNYSPPPKQRVLSSADIRGTVGVAADLPWRGTLEVSLVFPLPVSLDPERVARSEETVEVPVRFRISLQRGLKRVDIEAEVDNRARDHRLRVAFPTGIPAEKSIAEGTFWVNERPTRPPEAAGWVEDPPVTHPQKAFVTVEDGKGGFAIFNRGLPEYEVTPEGTIYLTLLRCVGWLSRGDLSTRRGHAGPPYETPEAQCPGKHTFRYAVYTYQGCWEEAGVLRMAQAFIAPPIAISWERTESIGERTFLFLDPDAVLLSAVKPPEEGEGIVIRIYNPTARYLEAVLRVGFPLSGARELRLDESPLRDLPIRGDILRLPLKGGEIKTIHLMP